MIRLGVGSYTGQFPLIILDESRGTSTGISTVNLASSPDNLDERVLVNFTNPRAQVHTRFDSIPETKLITLPGNRFKVPYAYHFALTVETGWGERWVTSLAYSGTQGRKLLRPTTPDLGPGRAYLRFYGSDPEGVINVTGGLAGFPVFHGNVGTPQSDRGSHTVYEGTGNSAYNSFQAEVRKSYSSGVQFGAAFTWSHTIDDVSDFFATAGAYALPQDSLHRSERGSSSFDARLRLAVHAVWDLFPRCDGLLHGWQVSGIYIAQSGQPYTVNSVIDVNQDGNLTDRLNRLDGLLQQQSQGGRVLLTDTGRLSPLSQLALPGQNGGVGRNTFRAHGLNQLDAALSKRFAVSGTAGFQLRFEGYNVFNRTHFAIPARLLESPGFGGSTSTISPNRTLQVALKFSF